MYTVIITLLIKKCVSVLHSQHPKLPLILCKSDKLNNDGDKVTLDMESDFLDILRKWVQAFETSK